MEVVYGDVLKYQYRVSTWMIRAISHDLHGLNRQYIKKLCELNTSSPSRCLICFIFEKLFILYLFNIRSKFMKKICFFVCYHFRT